MITKIVTGVDGSETATEAAQTAARLASATGAELHVVCAYPKLEIERLKTGSDEFVLNSANEAEEVAIQVAHAFRLEFPGLTVQATSALGKPAEALLEVAERLGADLIVVGNKRVQGLARALGSIAQHVAQQAHCDVYIAHTHRRG